MYSEILINDEVFHSYKMKEGDEMENLSRINILIGKNNSGKSRFLRTIFSISNLKFKSGWENLKVLSIKVKELTERAARFLTGWGYGNFQSEIKSVTMIDLPEFITKDFAFLDIESRITKLREVYSVGQTSELGDQVKAALGKNVDEVLPYLQNAAANFSTLIKIYIPVLRGLRPLQVITPEAISVAKEQFNGAVDNYLKRTESDYFEEEIKNSRIITGLHLYEETKRLLLGNLEERERVRAFEKFIQETFFPNNAFSITPKIDDDVVHIRIGAKERPIYELGDGIQAIIILTYPLFFHKDDHAVICFEEPETHLHPGLQRLFIETLLRPEFDKFQYFITTHSNHFLDLTADYNEISVYTFSKKEDTAEETFIIENVENEHENVLQLIGARTSSVFLSNCTIWVEGITDRMYLRQYLKVYQEQESIKKKFREDYHYSFVEYGGNNITHWSFLDTDDQDNNPTIDVTRLCAKLFLITDSDGASLEKDEASGLTKTQKEKRLIRLKQNLGKRYYCLKCREIENLLSPDVLKKTIIARAKKGIVPEFKSSFEQENYNLTPLGTFIKANVKNAGRKYEEGTITDKPGFCRAAIKHINSVDNLSSEALALAKKLYEFIAENNKM